MICGYSILYLGVRALQLLHAGTTCSSAAGAQHTVYARLQHWLRVRLNSLHLLESIQLIDIGTSCTNWWCSIVRSDGMRGRIARNYDASLSGQAIMPGLFQNSREVSDKGVAKHLGQETRKEGMVFIHVLYALSESLLVLSCSQVLKQS